MTTKEMHVLLPDGLEARKIAELVQIAVDCASKVYIAAGEKKVNAKSIMGMMSLGLQKGDAFTVEADGEDEAQALDRIEKFVSAA
ncbi:MAG: HPr family phosphocarrier protein [Lachnospiraceae bacterium]|nr:HPr family phosphocarrier protein [Lachnospiraceae bacterium]